MTTIAAQEGPTVAGARFRGRRVPMAHVQLAVICVVIAVRVFLGPIDPDFWWHLRAGDLIAHGGIPRNDPFSWTMAGKPWVAHEWLSELLIYLAVWTFGYAVVAVAFAAVAAASLLIMYALARRLDAGRRALLLLTVVSVAIMGNFLSVRPQEFTWLLFALFVVVLEGDERGYHTNTWLLPPLTALWANLHLGFVYGLLAVGCWLLARVHERVRGGRPVTGPLLVSAACALAVALNPAGVDLYTYPFRYFSDAHALRLVAEWQRPSPLSPLAWPYFLAALILILTLLSANRPRPFLLVLTVAVLVISAQAVRNMAFVAILLPAVAGPALAARWTWAGRARDTHTTLNPILASAVVGGVAALACALWAAGGGAFSSMSATESGMPTGAAEFIADHYAGAHLYNDYNWGGYVVYKEYPTVPVFIDGRTDLYRSRIMEDYATIGRVEPGWQQLVSSYGIDVMLLRPQSHLARTLRTEPGWREVYSDGTASVFALRSAWQ